MGRMAFPVGEYIADELEARGWSYAFAAARIPGDLDENTLWLQLLCCVPAWFTHDIQFSQKEADLLARMFTVDAGTLMRLHERFMEHKAKMSAEQRQAAADSILAE